MEHQGLGGVWLDGKQDNKDKWGFACMLLLMSDVNGELTQGPNRFPRNLKRKNGDHDMSKCVRVVNLSIDFGIMVIYNVILLMKLGKKQEPSETQSNGI